MRTRWLAVGIIIVVAFVLVRALYVPPGPEKINYETVPLLPTEQYNPPIIELWEAMDREIPFDNKTAKFLMLSTSFDINGSFTVLEFGFLADMEGEPWVHSGFVLRNGSAYLSSQRLDYQTARPHPLEILTAVDSLPFREIPYGERGMNLDVFHHELNRTYDDTYGNIYAIENGTLRGLEAISIPGGGVWHTIEIYPILERRVIILNGEPQDESPPAKYIHEDPDAFVIFGSREIGLAESVVYA